MVVISLTDCPPKVRGDLSKWLFEVNSGVFVGSVSARVRDELWTRICDNLRSGRATMVFSAAGEQKLDFKVHNTTWEPVDYDGIRLMRRPIPGDAGAFAAGGGKLGFSKASQQQKARRMQASQLKKQQAAAYVVIDVETTGPSVQTDRIFELAALRVRQGAEAEEFSALVQADAALYAQIRALTGLAEERIPAEGIPLKQAVGGFLEFLGDDRIVCHDAVVSYGFLRTACAANGLRMPVNPCTDTLPLARRKVDGVSDHQLTTLAKALGLASDTPLSALPACRLTHQLYLKLNEI